MNRECSTGRLPWFNKLGEPFSPYIIGVSGGSGSGKSSVSNRIIAKLQVPWAIVLSLDSFYKSLTQDQIDAAYKNDHDFDSPASFDFDLVLKVLQGLKNSERVNVPIYDFKTHSRSTGINHLKLTRDTTLVYGANVIIFEGLFTLHDERIRKMLDLKVFVDTDSDIRLARRIKRDISERGRDLQGVLDQYARFVKPVIPPLKL
jgi:uridine kinase